MLRTLLIVLILTVVGTMAFSTVVVDMTSGSVSLPNQITLARKSKALIIDIRAHSKAGCQWNVVAKSLKGDDGEDILRVMNIRERFRGPATLGASEFSEITQVIVKPVIRRSKIKGGVLEEKSTTLELVYTRMKDFK